MGVIYEIESGKDIVLNEDFRLFDTDGTFGVIFRNRGFLYDLAVKIPRENSVYGMKNYGPERIINGATLRKNETEIKSLLSSIERRCRLRPRPDYGIRGANVMWDLERDEIVLIDFDDWERV